MEGSLGELVGSLKEQERDKGVGWVGTILHIDRNRDLLEKKKGVIRAERTSLTEMGLG
jgi:hypothetical protein